MQITACMIVKNEEKNLPTSLPCLASLASEIIVVDTGSQDRTVEIAKEFGAEVYSFQWENDFAKARNYALSKAGGDWIIFLDADEYFTDESVGNMKKAIAEAQKAEADVLKSLLYNYDKDDKVIQNITFTARVFRNDPLIRYQGSIHERLVHKGRNLVFYDATQLLKIIHTGYSKQEIADKNKGARNIELLLESLKNNSGNSDLHFYLAEAYMVNNKYLAALKHAFKVIKYNNVTLYGLYEKNYLNIIACMQRLQYPQEDLQLIIEEAFRKYPEFPDFSFYLGDQFLWANRFHDAIEAYHFGLSKVQNYLTSQSSAVTNISNALYGLGMLYCKLNNPQKGIEYFVKLLKDDRYYYAGIEQLLTVLARHEKPDQIAVFLTKIYDYTKLKDLRYLLQAALKTGNWQLAEYYIDKLQQPEQLKKELTYIEFLKGNYKQAALAYLDFYCGDYDSLDAIMCLLACMAGNRQEVLGQLKEEIKSPTLNRLVQKTLGEEIELSAEDNKEIAELLQEAVKGNVLIPIMSVFPWLLEDDNCLQAAQMAFYYERYPLAADLYHRYLESAGYVPMKKLAGILADMGVCLFRQEETAMALSFFNDAKSLNPQSYSIYEYAIMLYLEKGDKKNACEWALAASIYFPDSNYLKTIISE